jgi:hypothetical protein
MSTRERDDSVQGEVSNSNQPVEQDRESCYSTLDLPEVSLSDYVSLLRLPFEGGGGSSEHS